MPIKPRIYVLTLDFTWSEKEQEGRGGNENSLHFLKNLPAKTVKLEFVRKILVGREKSKSVPNHTYSLVFIMEAR